MEEWADEKLVEFCLREPERAREGFAVLIERYQDTLTRVLMSMLRNNADTQDLVQESFIRAWRKLDTLREPARFKHWLLTIGRNLARNRLTRTRTTVELLPEDRVTHRTAADEVEGEETRGRLWQALVKLDETYREPLMLFVEGLSPSEIAEVMSIKPATIRWRLHEARKMIREDIDDLDV